MKLNKKQSDCLVGLRWLIYGGRRSGRTSLMATVFIEQAMLMRGDWVYVFDHFTPECPRGDVVAREVERVFNCMGYPDNVKLYIDSSRKRIRIQLEDGIESEDTP